MDPETSVDRNAENQLDYTTLEETAPTKRPTEAQNLWGMLLVTAFLFILTIQNSIVSYIGGCTLQWIVARCLAFVVICPLVWIPCKPSQEARIFGDTFYDTKVIMAHALLEVTGTYLYLYTLHALYVGDIEAIFLFIAPNVIAFIGRVWFKEKLPQYVGVILAVNIVGVVFVTQPSFIFGSEESLPAWSLVMLLTQSTVLYPLDITLIGRHPNIHWTQLQLGSGLFALCVFMPLLYGVDNLFGTDLFIGGQIDFGWEMLASNALFTFVSIMGYVCLIFGYQLGDAAKISFLEYIVLVFAYSMQWAVFGELRNVFEIIGAALIGSSCFILLFSQYRLYDDEKKANQSSEYTHLLHDSDQEDQRN